MASAPESIDYLDGVLPLVGQLIRPEGPPRAAVLMLPTIRGCDDVILRRAGLLADQGYMTLVADFYGRTFEERSQMMAAGFALMDDAAGFRARLAAALDTLLRLSNLPVARSAVVGHCMGGAGALELGGPQTGCRREFSRAPVDELAGQGWCGEGAAIGVPRPSRRPRAASAGSRV